jgi:hypothetical protein
MAICAALTAWAEKAACVIDTVIDTGCREKLLGKVAIPDGADGKIHDIAQERQAFLFNSIQKERPASCIPRMVWRSQSTIRAAA